MDRIEKAGYFSGSDSRTGLMIALSLVVAVLGLVIFPDQASVAANPAAAMAAVYQRPELPAQGVGQDGENYSAQASPAASTESAQGKGALPMILDERGKRKLLKIFMLQAVLGS